MHWFSPAVLLATMLGLASAPSNTSDPARVVQQRSVAFPDTLDERSGAIRQCLSLLRQISDSETADEERDAMEALWALSRRHAVDESTPSFSLGMQIRDSAGDPVDVASDWRDHAAVVRIWACDTTLDHTLLNAANLAVMMRE